LHIMFLGTASAEGYPASFCTCSRCREARRLGGRNIRYRAAALLDGRLLIDLPPDLYAASLRCGVSLPGVRYVLVTHTHPDHFYVEELRLRAPPFSREGAGGLVLAGSRAAVSRAEEALRGYRGVGVEYLPLRPGVEVELDEYRVTPIPAVHNVPPGEEPFNYIIGRGGREVLYALDTGPYGEEQYSLLRGHRLSLVVADATMGLLGRGAYRYHMSIADVEELRRRLVEEGVAGPETRFVLTHFSHNGSPPHDELAGLLEGRGLEAAYDCMEVEA